MNIIRSTISNQQIYFGVFAEVLGGCVGAYEDDVRFFYSFFDIRTEKQVSFTGGFDDLVETGFVYGKVVRVPGGNAIRVDVDYGDFVLGAFVRNHGHRRATDIPCADA